MCDLTSVPEYINFAQEEKNILEFWKSIDAFISSVKASKGKPRYTFYDGPPFATGLPHYGHILAGTIKDIVTRFFHQKGYYVERRFGWDTHGLPIEYEIDKTLNLKGPEDILKLGIKKYNDECRKIVMKYSKEWISIMERLGRWIDFENDYKTLYPWFMESVWWVFKQLFLKGLVYRGFKVMPFSTACNTPISNFESGQNYKEVIDPSVIVSFPLLDDLNTSVVAWTTTPWTLPSNLAICVNPNLNYVKVQDRIQILFKTPEDYIVLENMKGKDLKGKKYEPLFNYFVEHQKYGAFQILTDSYVTEESGTGVVHMAPYFGEVDYNVCLSNGIVSQGRPIVCPVDDKGYFTHPVVDFMGQYVKDADKKIIRYLRSSGRLIKQDVCQHSYPFCWRSDTPLIYKAVPSWFVRVESFSNNLLECLQNTYWVPDTIKDKRFANWLTDARDWAISRNRFWGTPIPIWASSDFEEIVCVGSIQELEELTGVHATDLHREYIDHLEIPSKRTGQPPLRRVAEVFDCWFESGCMPYAQVHYPFEHKNEFHECFPANFIAEGVDQTRGWFYTLLVISSVLFGKAPYKNVIANGLVLAHDGQKMSKRKKNYPDPLSIINKYGADALRLYLINSPVVKADNLRFKEEGVKDVLKDFMLPWYNAYRYFVQQVHYFEKTKQCSFKLSINSNMKVTNLMDCWILSTMQSLINHVHKEMNAYHLHSVLPQLVSFIDQLTNWYIRMNRRRFKGETTLEDCCKCLQVLFEVLYSFLSIMSPFTPFFAEFIYQNLCKLIKCEVPSVHFLELTKPKEYLINPVIERAVSRMQTIIESGRILRDRKSLPLKYPLPELIVIHKDKEYLEDLQSLKNYIMEELNIRSLITTTDCKSYGITFKVDPNYKSLGTRFRSDLKTLLIAIKELTDDQIDNFTNTGIIKIQNHILDANDLLVSYTFKKDSSDELKKTYEIFSENRILALLNVNPDKNMLNEGMAREIINHIQKLRKRAHLVPTDDIIVNWSVEPPTSHIVNIINDFKTYIENNLKVPFSNTVMLNKPIIEQSIELKNANLKFQIGSSHQSSILTFKTNIEEDSAKPMCRFANIIVLERNEILQKACILYENPKNMHILTVSMLKEEIELLFDISINDYYLYESLNPLQQLPDNLKDVNTVFVCIMKFPELQPFDISLLPYSKYVNVLYDSSHATIFLENPVGHNSINFSQLNERIRIVFNLPALMSLSITIESTILNLDARQETSHLHGCLLEVK